MPKGKYFRVRSRMNGFVLDVYTGVCEPGQRVVMWEAKEDGYDNQLWRSDPLTRTIRSKADENYCLDVDGKGILTVNKFSDSDTQRWKVSHDRVQKSSDPNTVLDIAEGHRNAGAKVIKYGFHGGDHQLWDFEYEQPQYFFLRSKMNGLVLDVYYSSRAEGARVIMWPKQRTVNDNQLWYEDNDGYLRSKLSNMVFDASGKEICLHTYNARSDCQKWVLQDDKIVNVDHPKDVLDIKSRCEDEDQGACIIPWRYHGGNNQRWEVIVV